MDRANVKKKLWYSHPRHITEYMPQSAAPPQPLHKLSWFQPDDDGTLATVICFCLAFGREYVRLSLTSKNHIPLLWALRVWHTVRFLLLKLLKMLCSHTLHKQTHTFHTVTQEYKHCSKASVALHKAYCTLCIHSEGEIISNAQYFTCYSGGPSLTFTKIWKKNLLWVLTHTECKCYI